MINYREGFDINDDILPDRFYEDALTKGSLKGAVLKREDFAKVMNAYYQKRLWNTENSRPSDEKLKELQLDFLTDI